MARVLITGGSGFIGTNLVARFVARSDEVANVDIVRPRNPDQTPFWRNVSILDRNALSRSIADFNPEIVFHMAARTDLDGGSAEDYVANTEGVANLIAAVRELSSLRSVVFASSMLVCRVGYVPNDETDYCPNTFYGESKVEGERLVRERAGNSVPWTIVRPTSIWGPWFGTPYRDFFDAVRRGVYVHPRGRRIRRSYGFVLNTVSQLARIADRRALMNRTEYLADYEPIELKQWADTIQGQFQSRPVREIPLWILRAGAWCGDGLKQLGYRSPPLTSGRLSNLLTEMVFDTTPIQSVCPDLPYSMGEGVRMTCDWLRDHT